MFTLLLADDVRHILQSLSNLVARSKLPVDIVGIARDGRQALELFEAHQPDIVLTDIYMPFLNGLQFAQEIRRRNPDTAIIILSGHDNFENAREAMKFGIHHFLLKPADVKEIRSVLQEVCVELETSRRRRQWTEQYVRNLESMLPGMRVQFFRELIFSRYRAGEIPVERLAFLGFPPDCFVQSVSYQICRPSILTRLTEKDWQLLLYGAQNIMDEMARQSLPGCSGSLVPLSENKYVQFWWSPEPIDQEALYHLCNLTVDHIRSYLKIGVEAGIGGLKPHLHLASESFAESEQALENGELVNDQSTVMEYSAEKHDEFHFMEMAAQFEQGLGDLATRRNGADLMELWQRMERRILQSRQIGLSIVHALCIRIFSSLVLYWSERCIDQRPPISIDSFPEDIRRTYTIPALVNYMREVFDIWKKAFDRRNCNPKHHPLVEQVRAYVEMHYHEEITLQHIAGELHVNYSYLSHLFKKAAGMNFVAYLNRFRIEKAVELLRTGQFLVYEVSEMVGFKNPHYFSSVFKAVAGTSPKLFLLNDAESGSR